MEENDGIGDKRAKFLAGSEVVLEDFFAIQGRQSVTFENGVVLLDTLREFCSEDFWRMRSPMRRPVREALSA